MSQDIWRNLRQSLIFLDLTYFVNSPGCVWWGQGTDKPTGASCAVGLVGFSLLIIESFKIKSSPPAGILSALLVEFGETSGLLTLTVELVKPWCPALESWLWPHKSAELRSFELRLFEECSPAGLSLPSRRVLGLDSLHGDFDYCLFQQEQQWWLNMMENLLLRIIPVILLIALMAWPHLWKISSSLSSSSIIIIVIFINLVNIIIFINHHHCHHHQYHHHHCVHLCHRRRAKKRLKFSVLDD